MRHSNICPDAPRLFLIALIFATAAFAIDPHRAMSQYVHDRWGTEEGFPRGAVYGLAQTPDGYLWIGAESGLVRFDGVDFRNIKGDSLATSFVSVLGIVASREGSLWLRRADATIVRLFDGHFEILPENDHFKALNRRPNGDLLAERTQVGAVTFVDQKLKLLVREEGVPRSPVLAVAETGNGDVWLGTRGAGLFRVRQGLTEHVANLPDPKVNCLLASGEDLYIGTDAGLALWNGHEVVPVIPELGKSQILALVRDRDGNLWIGTDSGSVLRWNGRGLAQLDANENDVNNAITGLLEDREGNIWIGRTNSLERLRDSHFLTYSQPEGLPVGGPSPIYVDDHNRTWFAPAAGGLKWFSDTLRGSVESAGVGNDVVYSLAKGKDGTWIGRQRGGLTQLREGQAITFTTANGLAQNSVYSVYEAPNGVVWAGTLSGGVSRFEHGKFTNYSVADGLASNTVVSIQQTPDGTTWFATPTGLTAFTGTKWKTYRVADGLSADNINCLFEDAKGTLWVGTTGGLSYWRNGRFEKLSPDGYSLREPILGIAQDRFSALWIATSDHVLRIAGNQVTQFTTADGLRSVLGVKRHQSVVADASGRIWLSLNRGISVVDPDRVAPAAPPALPQIAGISADGQSIPLGPSAVRVAPGKQRVEISYSGLSLSIPQRVRFRYLLEGSDLDWSQDVSDRHVSYTNLGPGTYHFHLRAANPEGVWSSSEARLDFTVAPAWWQTAWFRALAMVCGCMIILALYRLRLSQLTSRLNLRFEERLAERNRIAQELHDTLLQGFLSASMQTQIAAERLTPDSPVKPGLNRALELMRQVIEEARNAVRGLRSSRSASIDLEQALERIRDEFEEDDIDFQVTSAGERRNLHPVLRDDIYRIGREAVLNAFRHSKASRIEVEINYASSALRLSVCDNGQGIDAQTLKTGRDGHWGLSGMRERAARIGARFSIRSTPGNGTIVELALPGISAYVTPKPSATSLSSR